MARSDAATEAAGAASAVADTPPAADSRGGSTAVLHSGARKLPRFTPRKSRAPALEPVEVGEDAWLESLEEAPQRTGIKGLKDLFADSLGGTSRLLGDVWGFLTTSVGRLLALMLALTLVLLSAGYALSHTAANRESALETMLDATEPMSNSAQTLYTSLSQADTLATTSFIQPGLQTAESHSEYMATIDRAVIAADDVLRGSVVTNTDTAEVQTLVREIQRQIPQYTGLMERAQANQRVGNPLGVAYMTQASTMMREDMLVSAEQILTITRGHVSDEMNRLSVPRLGPLLVLIVAIALLVFTQWVLWRMFRRRLNRGFLGATALMLVIVAWCAVSAITLWDAGRRDFQAAADPLEQLASARISAQETRTDETLILLTRRTGERSGSTMRETVDEVSAALSAVENEDNASLVNATLTHLTTWHIAHTRMMNALQSGDYEEAVTLAAANDTAGRGGASSINRGDSSTAGTNSTGEPTAASAFRDLDDSLTELISGSRSSTRASIDDALSASRDQSVGLMVLAVLTVLLTWLGIRPRIQEYL